MPIRSDVDQILLSKFTSTTSDSRISDQLLMSKGPGSMRRKLLKKMQYLMMQKRVPNIYYIYLDFNTATEQLLL